MWIDIVPREIWGAGVASSTTTELELPAAYVFCMSTFTLTCLTDDECFSACQRIQHFEIARRGYKDVRFNFLVGGRGQIYEGRGWYSAPFLPSDYSSIHRKTILLGFIGNFKEENLPRPMRESRDEIVNYGIEKKFIAEDFQSFKILDKKASD